MSKKNTYGALTQIAGLDRSRFVVKVIVARRDNEPLTEEDYALCEKALPRIETFDDLEKAETAASTAPERKSA